MKKQPEALRLAKLLDNEQVRTVAVDVMHCQAAAELLRQHKEIELLRQQLAQQEEKPEPVAWMCPYDPERETAFSWKSGACVDCGKQRIPVYTIPPHRPWVGLTDEEIEKLFVWQDWSEYFVEYEPVARAIEAKLKEKNT